MNNPLNEDIVFESTKYSLMVTIALKKKGFDFSHLNIEQENLTLEMIFGAKKGHSVPGSEKKFDPSQFKGDETF